jgi:alpha-1,2-mannosyltransferase
VHDEGGSIIRGAGHVPHRHVADRPAESADPQTLPAAAVWLPIALLAFVARLLPMLRGGGLGGIVEYDDGVYFAGAQALIAGRLPYRDFVLLHPPGSILVLSPFAAFARVVSDHPAFELVRVAVMGLGSLNAVLTAAVARRSRVGGPVAAAVAGVLYAVWPPAIEAESTTLLEPWTTLGLLVALLLLYRRPARSHHEFLAGAALGAATAVKIWGLVPLVVVLVWELVLGRRRSAARVALGAAAAVTVVCLPFFLGAPGAMFRMVVVDQLGRGEVNAGVLGRLSGILGVASSGSGARPPGWLLVAAVAVVCALVVAGAVIDRAWLMTALLGAVVTLLLEAPSFFVHYAAFAAVPLLILAGAGSAALAALTVRHMRARSRAFAGGRILMVALAITVAPLTAFACVVAGLHRGSGFPGERLRQAAASSRCVTADSPVALIQMDLLGRDLERRCRLWIDVTGLTYDTAGARYPNGDPIPRQLNRGWQQALIDYLLSGDATILIRRAGDGLAPDTARTIDHLPVLVSVSGHTLWQVPPGRAAAPTGGGPATVSR